VTHVSITCKYSTVNNYLGAVSSLHVTYGYRSLYQEHPSLNKLMSSIQRDQGGAAMANAMMKRKFPITAEVIVMIEPVLRSICTPFEYRMWMALMYTAVFGLFRISEIAVTPVLVHRTLKLKNIIFYSHPMSLAQQSLSHQSSSSNSQQQIFTAPFNSSQLAVLSKCSHFIIRLESSKTDAIGVGVDQTVAGAAAVANVSQYLCVIPSSRSSSLHPLFQSSGGLPVTRDMLVSVLQQCLQSTGIDMSKYRGFSFRRGGATGLAAAGVDNITVQHIGRWSTKTNIASRYIHTEATTYVRAASQCQPQQHNKK
jgi:hypothetical protein